MRVVFILVLVWLLIGAVRGSHNIADTFEERIDPCVTSSTCQSTSP